MPPLSKTTSLAAFADTLRGLGAPVDSALRRAKLPLAYNERPDAWVSYRAMRIFIGDLCDREALGDLGMRAALHSSQRGLHPALRTAVYAAPTLFHAMTTICEKARIQSSHLRVWTESHSDSIRLCFRHPIGPGFPGYEVVESFTTRQLVTMLRHFCGPGWIPARVFTQFDSVKHRGARLDLPFAEEGVPIARHGSYAGFEVPIETLWAGNRGRARRIESLGESPGPTDTPKGIAEVLRSSLGPYLNEGGPSLELAAEIAGLSSRSLLQRALAMEHTTFRKLLALARLDCALSDIRNLDIPLSKIARRLGYSEPSAFSRAFRASVGVPPSAYRARLQARSDETPKA